MASNYHGDRFGYVVDCVYSGCFRAFDGGYCEDLGLILEMNFHRPGG
jgi:hypothetical protein